MIDLFDGIEYDEDDPEMCQIDSDDARDDLRWEILSALSHRWNKAGPRDWRRDDRDCRIIASNAYHEVWTHEDGHGHVFVTFGVTEDCAYTLEGIAENTFETRACTFFDKLQQAFPNHTYVATSAWTSTRRAPSNTTSPLSEGVVA